MAENSKPQPNPGQDPDDALVAAVRSRTLRFAVALVLAASTPSQAMRQFAA